MTFIQTHFNQMQFSASSKIENVEGLKSQLL